MGENNEMKQFIDASMIILVKPLNMEIRDFDNASNLRSILNILQPYKLYNAMVEGVNDFCNEYGKYVSDTNFRTIKYTFSKLEEKAEELSGIWTILDKYERTSVLDYFDEGMFSDETIFGTTFGTLILPGIGTFLGALLGGWATGKRLANQAQEIMTIYINGVGRYMEIFQECIEKFLKEFVYDICYQIELQEREETKKITSNTSECPYCGEKLSSIAINRGRCSECGKYI